MNFISVNRLVDYNNFIKYNINNNIYDRYYF